MAIAKSMGGGELKVDPERERDTMTFSRTRTLVALLAFYTCGWVMIGLRWHSPSKQVLVDTAHLLGYHIRVNVSAHSHFPPPWRVRVLNGTFLPSFSTGLDQVIPLETLKSHNEFEYEPFRISEPLFPRELDKKLFTEYPDGRELLEIPPYNKRRGVVDIIENGYFPGAYLCGWPSSYKLLQAKSQTKVHYHKICPLMSPEGSSFQHFIDGLLPKLIQVRDIILHKDMKVLIPKPRTGDSDVILGILKRFGLNESQIVWGDKRPFSADFLVASCITPPIHPLLWHTARRLMGVRETPLPPGKGYVVLLTRAKSHNGGRKLLNKEEITQYLQRRYGAERVVVFQGGYSFNKTLELFGNTSLMIGVHGGAFYNMNFSPKKTRVLEIIPHHGNGYLKGLATTIFWSMASMIGQEYWRLFIQTQGSINNVILNMTILHNALKKIDNTAIAQ